MSAADVQAIMVLSPGNYSTDLYTTVGKEEEGQRAGSDPRCWISNSGMIEVEFDAAGRVCWKAFHRLETQSSVPQRLKSLWWSVKRLF